ncbi:hypothetical protein C8R44DRAFT_743069 [Mycena epipterygia]|nr:hypothetical protein C8R44DRAFT_743069 [Mycena epipterygia]
MRTRLEGVLGRSGRRHYRAPMNSAVTARFNHHSFSAVVAISIRQSCNPLRAAADPQSSPVILPNECWDVQSHTVASALVPDGLRPSDLSLCGKLETSKCRDKTQAGYVMLVAKMRKPLSNIQIIWKTAVWAFFSETQCQPSNYPIGDTHPLNPDWVGKSHARTVHDVHQRPPHLAQPPARGPHASHPVNTQDQGRGGRDAPFRGHLLLLLSVHDPVVVQEAEALAERLHTPPSLASSDTRRPPAPISPRPESPPVDRGPPTPAPSPTLTISLNLSLRSAAKEDAARRRKMTKLFRTLGANIPPELVFPALSPKAKEAMERRARRLTARTVVSEGVQRAESVVGGAQENNINRRSGVSATSRSGRTHSKPESISHGWVWVGKAEEIPAGVRGRMRARGSTADGGLPGVDSGRSRADSVLPEDWVTINRPDIEEELRHPSVAAFRTMHRKEARDGWSGEWRGDTVQNMEDVVERLRVLKIR